MDDFEIDIEQGSNIQKSKDIHSEMQLDISDIVDDLRGQPDKFTQEKCENVCNKIKKYIEKYKRILYSTISNKIYHIHKEDLNNNSIDTILINLDKLMNYCLNKYGIESETYKIIVKIWDHINLAHQQYQELYLSDQEYQAKFNNQMQGEKTTLYREINSHMVTMIGIFTALSFVIFGGINSIETAFSGIEDTPITKLMVIGCVWGLGLLNLVYVFLYCIAKLSGLNFKNNIAPDANFYKRYQFIVVSNIAMFILLFISLWLYFISKTNYISEVVLMTPYPLLVYILLPVVVIIMIICFVWNRINKE